MTTSYARRLLATAGRAALAVTLVVGATALGEGIATKSADAATPDHPDGTCRQVDLPVALTRGGARDQRVTGQLCTPATWSSGPRQLEVLVHGATYTRTYWDWPVKASRYSYVDRALAAGRATFAYDRPGVGASSRPLSTAVTLAADAYVMHQVVGWLRTTQRYAAVDAVAHSLGSLVAIREAGTYRDVRRLVLTGMMHLPGSTKSAPRLAGRIYPAAADPQFRAAHPGVTVDPGNLTTTPGSRASLFYAAHDEKDVIAYDEAHKDVVSTTETAGAFGDMLSPAATSAARRITAPVLVVMGSDDHLFCCIADAATTEKPYYDHAANLTVRTIPGAGHDLTLSPTASNSFNVINRWITDTPATAGETP